MKRYTALLLCSLIAPAASMANNMELIICPQAKQLNRDSRQHWWYTSQTQDPSSSTSKVMVKHKWYSTSPSLAKKMGYFIGAQYSGIAEGHIVCLYLPNSTKQVQGFPVVVHYEGLVMAPKEGEWHKDSKRDGILNCVSSDPTQCPYLLYHPDNVTDPYEALRKLA